MHSIEVMAEETAKANLDVITGVGIVLFIACGGAFWALIHLRGNTVTRLWSEIDFAFEALTEKAFASLEALRSHIEELIPDSGVDFDPLDVIVDPSSVEKPAKASIKLLKERHKIRRRYALLLKVCSFLKYGVLACTVFIGLATACYAFLFGETWLWQSLSWSAAALTVSCLLFLAAYTTLVAQIDGVIEKSKPKATRTVVSSR